jgi:hypothetical protein
MNINDFFLTLLQEHYIAPQVSLYNLSEASLNADNLLYRIQHPDGTYWIARIYRRDRDRPDCFTTFIPGLLMLWIWQTGC